jgi:hypothetical protein
VAGDAGVGHGLSRCRLDLAVQLRLQAREVVATAPALGDEVGLQLAVLVPAPKRERRDTEGLRGMTDADECS